MTTYYNKDQEPASERVRVRRAAARGSYDRAAVHAVFDEALVCHVGFVDGGQPFVLPTIHARLGDTLYLHGAVGNRMLGVVRSGAPVCVEATIVDGLVLARSAFHHSMNYRSAVVLGSGHEVVEPEEKARVLHAMVERLTPGRSADARPPSPAELRATRVVAVPLEECSAKARTGPPLEEEADYALPVWAGVLPVAVQAAGLPVPDPRVHASAVVPGYVSGWGR